MILYTYQKKVDKFKFVIFLFDVPLLRNKITISSDDYFDYTYCGGDYGSIKEGIDWLSHKAGIKPPLHPYSLVKEPPKYGFLTGMFFNKKEWKSKIIRCDKGQCTFEACRLAPACPAEKWP